MSPLPSMAHTFALLIQEEKQREFKPNNQIFTKASSMNSSMNPSMMNASSSGSSGGKSFMTNYSPNNNANGRSRPFCDHCRKLGHTKGKCFKIHGYPQKRSHGNAQNHKGHSNQNRFNHNQNHQNRYNNNQSQYNSNYNHRYAKWKGITTNAFEIDTELGIDGPSNNSVPNLSKKQYGQLLNLRQSFQMSKCCRRKWLEMEAMI
ncbi:uncharacterized protein LOC129875557 [Solanum dulcamara]|uniref:uncharacterized protein LOC129875557 n=1 Tax=Solanum dulcamara TaxID=45834 RepID=UPI002486066D|nr:uncharacterized protein LOC129875557 [Solanum dulcamara]